MAKEIEEIDEDESDERKKYVAKDCKVLYDGADHPCWACGSGWDPILEKLSYQLESLNVRYAKPWGVKVVSAQVKEKYGTLRFYFDCHIEGIEENTREQEVMLRYVQDLADDYVRQAEKDCFNVCELCGETIGTPEHPRCETLGWVKYVCRNCVLKLYDGHERYFMEGKFYEGKKRIPNPFRKKAKK